MEPSYAEETIKARRNTGKEEAPETKETMYQLENNKEKGYVIVRYEQLELKKADIMGGRTEMLLPENLKEMDGELMKRKYPDPDRPEWIVSDAEGEAAMTFHLEAGEVGEGELEQIAGLLRKEMKRLYPASPIEEEEPVGTGKESVCWFSLDIPLADDWCCHTMFFREMRDGVLMGTFDCSRDGKKEWKAVLKRILPMIREKNRKGEDKDDGESDGHGVRPL